MIFQNMWTNNFSNITNFNTVSPKTASDDGVAINLYLQVLWVFDYNNESEERITNDDDLFHKSNHKAWLFLIILGWYLPQWYN